MINTYKRHTHKSIVGSSILFKYTRGPKTQSLRTAPPVRACIVSSLQTLQHLLIEFPASGPSLFCPSMHDGWVHLQKKMLFSLIWFPCSESINVVIFNSYNIFNLISVPGLSTITSPPTPSTLGHPQVRPGVLTPGHTFVHLPIFVSIILSPIPSLYWEPPLYPVWGSTWGIELRHVLQYLVESTYFLLGVWYGQFTWNCKIENKVQYRSQFKWLLSRLHETMFSTQVHSMC